MRLGSCPVDLLGLLDQLRIRARFHQGLRQALGLVQLALDRFQPPAEGVDRLDELGLGGAQHLGRLRDLRFQVSLLRLQLRHGVELSLHGQALLQQFDDLARVVKRLARVVKHGVHAVGVRFLALGNGPDQAAEVVDPRLLALLLLTGDLLEQGRQAHAIFSFSER